MRASIAHVLGTAVLVALPVLVSAQAPAAAPAAQPTPPPPPSVKVGDAAPDFDLAYFAPVGDPKELKYEPKRVKLSDYKGKQNVVVAFFPAAFSPGCTNEMKQYATAHGTFTEANTTILGVSVDSTWSNRAFREQLGVPFPILSDWKRDAARQYGLLDENSGVARRATFVVDKTGVVRKVDVGREALDPSGVVGMCKTLETH
ncbi:MAG: redoxin domain-containing protein [Vicinamibacteraceae bacterium]